MLHYCHHLSAVLVCSLCPFILLAQSEVSFSYYSIKDGLAGNYVHGTFMDSRGYIWIATSTGLSRFDGESFTNYYHDPEDSISLSSDMIYDITEDDEGKIWIATGDGLNLFDPEYEKFFAYKHDPNDSTSISAPRIRRLTKDSDGKIWISTLGGGWNVFDKKKGTFQSIHLTLPEKIPGPSFAYRLNTVGRPTEDVKDSDLLWVSTMQGLYEFHKNKNRFRKILSPGQQYFSTHGTILTDNPNEIWVSTWGVGLGCYHPSTEKWDFFYTRPDLKGDIKSQGLSNIVLDIKFKSQNEIWVGTQNEGLLIFDRNTETFRVALPGISITDLRLDRFNRLWMSTQQGLYLYDPQKQEIPFVKIEDHQFTGNPGALDCLEVIMDYEGNYYIAVLRGAGVYVFDKYLNPKGVLTLPLRPNYKDNPNYTWDLISDLHIDKDNVIWGIDRNRPSRLFRINAARDKIDCYFQQVVEDLPVKSMRLMLEDSNGIFWVATVGEGLLKIAPELDTVVQFVGTDKDEVVIQNGEPILDFKIDNQQRIWIASQTAGIYVFDIAKEEFVSHYTNDKSSRIKLQENRVQSLAFDLKGQLWVGYQNKGIQIVDIGLSTPQTLKIIGPKDGLLGSGIKSINAMPNGNMAIGTIEGVFIYDVVQGKVIDCRSQYHLENGFYGKRMVHVLPNGAIASTEPGGFYLFNPDSIPLNRIPPPIVFTDFRVFSTSRKFEKNLNFLNAIKLNYQENFFTISFAALNFTQKERRLYAYKLEGFDENWVFGSYNSAGYTNVPEGKYTFYVKAANEDGIWNGEAITIDIFISPPWFRTKIAYVGYMFLFIVLAYGLWFFQEKRWIERTRFQLREAEAQQLRELNNAKSKLYTNITHEFRTPLTNILNFAKKIQFSGDAPKIISRNSQVLLLLVNQMLDLAKVDSGMMQIKKIRADIIPFLKYLLESFHSAAEQKNIDLIFQSEQRSIEMDFDPQLIQQIMSNLLSNAFKFSLEGGKIKVSVVDRNTRLEIIVHDNGLGIKQENLKYIFDRFYQEEDNFSRGTGIGLSLVKELIGLMEGSIQVTSEKNKGTIFTILLPITQEAEKKEQTSMETPFIALERSNYLHEDQEHSEDKPSILIVEDNWDVSVYLRILLVQDYRLLFAKDGAEGIKKAEEHVPDLIISDVMMPKMNGFEMTRHLKRQVITSHIPIILLTAKADMTSKLEGLQDGANDYLVKPFHDGELLLRLTNMLESRKALQERFQSLQINEKATDLATQREDTFIINLRKTVEANISSEFFGIDDICSAMRISRTQLHQKLKAITGRKTSYVIRSIRLQRAKELLETSDLNVSEVSLQVGFSNPNYFSNLFMQEFGFRPSKLKN